jgi:zinc transport system substrate-binding protein
VSRLSGWGRALACLLAVAAIGCRQESRARAAGPLRVAATVPPLASLAEAVGGEEIEVISLLGPRDDPEATPLSMGALRVLAAADLVVAVGAPALVAERRLLAAGGGVAAERMVRLCGEEHPCAAGADDHGRHGVDDDPHLWLDPEIMLDAAERLAGRLAQLDPGRGPDLARRVAELRLRVGAADERIRDRVAPRAGGVLFTDHPTWGRFAERYGVRQLGLEQEDREPSPRRLREVIEEARRSGVEALAVTAGGSNRLARAVARELGIPTVEVEPLAYDWLASLERVATLVAPAPDPADG